MTPHVYSDGAFGREHASGDRNYVEHRVRPQVVAEKLFIRTGRV